MGQYSKPLPQITLDTQEFWEGCKRRELLIQRCLGCGALRFYPRPMCSDCNSMDTEWIKANGKGKIYTWIVTYHVVHPGFAAEAPYVVAIVELEEGVRMTTNVVDCTAQDIYFGMPVEVVFDDVTDQITLPKFRPLKAK